MQTSKQRTVSDIAGTLNILGLEPHNTNKLAKCLYSGVESQHVQSIIHCKRVGSELVLYGKDTIVVWDTVLAEIDTTLKVKHV